MGLGETEGEIIRQHPGRNTESLLETRQSKLGSDSL